MKNKKIVVLSAALIVLIAIAASVYFLTKPSLQQGEKAVTVVVAAENHETQTLTLQTDEEFLEGALLGEKLIGGEETQFGFFITTVAEIEAKTEEGEWWCITKNGEEVFTGAAETPIQDGDQFEITLKVGY